MGIFVLRFAAFVATVLFCTVVVFLLPYWLALPSAVAVSLALIGFADWVDQPQRRVPGSGRN